MRSPSREASGKHLVTYRLLIGGISLAVLLMAVVCLNVAESMKVGSHTLNLGHDFLPSYVAGTLVREGRARAMYDSEVVGAEDKRIKAEADLGIDFSVKGMARSRVGYPWLNPPFFAWVFVPLSSLPYRWAALCFLGLNLVLLGGSVGLLWRQLPDLGKGMRWVHLALVPLLICTSMPFIQALCHQQNTFLSLAIVCGAATLWLEDRPSAAGCVAGLLLFKPQLGVVLGIVLGAWDRKALGGLVVTAGVLLLVMVVTLPGTAGDYLAKLPPMLHSMQTQRTYGWSRHATLHSFWWILVQGHGMGETSLLATLLWWGSEALLAGGLGVTMVRVLIGPTWISRVYACGRGEGQAMLAGGLSSAAGYARVENPRHGWGFGSEARRAVVSVAIVSMPLLMPYFMDYDLLLLALPAVLFARRWLETDVASRSRLDRWELAIWVVLFIAMELNTGVSAMTRVVLVVPVLVGLAGVMMAQCWLLAGRAGKAIETPTDAPVAIAA